MVGVPPPPRSAALETLHHRQLSSRYHKEGYHILHMTSPLLVLREKSPQQGAPDITAAAYVDHSPIIYSSYYPT